MSAVSLTEAASEAVARSRLALRKTYPEMPMPKRASSETAATRRLRILQTVPPDADALIAGISCTPKVVQSCPVRTWSRRLRRSKEAHRLVLDGSGGGIARKMRDEIPWPRCHTSALADEGTPHLPH